MLPQSCGGNLSEFEGTIPTREWRTNVSRAKRKVGIVGPGGDSEAPMDPRTATFGEIASKEIGSEGTRRTTWRALISRFAQLDLLWRRSALRQICVSSTL
jgi:hypothetical protein